jgi:hypothetical protein
MEALKISKDNDDIVIELQLAKIKVPKKKREISLKWYANNIDIMLKILVEGLLNCPERQESSNWWWLVNCPDKLPSPRLIGWWQAPTTRT